VALLSDVILALTILGTLYYVLSTLALARHFRHNHKKIRHQISAHEITHAHQPKSGRSLSTEGSLLPRISVLKPVSGLDFDARRNFLSYLEQDYPDYEVLFGALDPNDPAVNVVADAISNVENASLHVGSRIEGPNNKVRILDNLMSHASGEIIVVTDADTRVPANFLSNIVRSFVDDQVGAVTCLYRGFQAKTIADALEGLHMTCVFAPGVAAANALRRIDFGLGAAIAIRKNVLNALGGFKSVVDYLADDFHLCHKVVGAGYIVELSDLVVDIVLSGEPLRRVVERQLRWSRTTRVSRPWGHLGLLLSFGFVHAVGFLAVSSFSQLGWLVLATVTTIRLTTAWYGARVCLDDQEFNRRIYLLPICDLFSFGIWIAGYFSNTVVWRARKLKLLRDGRMIELEK